jgi:hypothetical protein
VKRSSSAETAARFLAMRGVRAAVHRPRSARASVPASAVPPIRLHARPEALAARGLDAPRVVEHRVIRLASGGTITLSVSASLMKSAKADRDFVLGLLDRIDDYENGSTDDAGEVSR